eukprot:757156-Prymnesium_polylepis.1
MPHHFADRMAYGWPQVARAGWPSCGLDVDPRRQRTLYYVSFWGHVNAFELVAAPAPPGPRRLDILITA